jgi:hypothetical protein
MPYLNLVQWRHLQLVKCTTSTYKFYPSSDMYYCCFAAVNIGTQCRFAKASTMNSNITTVYTYPSDTHVRTRAHNGCGWRMKGTGGAGARRPEAMRRRGRAVRGGAGVARPGRARAPAAADGGARGRCGERSGHKQAAGRRLRARTTTSAGGRNGDGCACGRVRPSTMGLAQAERAGGTGARPGAAGHAHGHVWPGVAR